jgi:Ca2+-binding RTX toxin-like protein
MSLFHTTHDNHAHSASAIHAQPVTDIDADTATLIHPQTLATEGVINGTDQPDIIIGDNDGDIINSGDGNDTVIGGTGDDTINLGNGDDLASGGGGNNTIFAGAGTDDIWAGNITQTVGDGSHTVIHGGSGNDTMHGVGNGDMIAGSGDNVMIAGVFHAPDGTAIGDTMVGGPGHNTFIGGQGNDQMFGEGGQNTFVFHEADGPLSHDSVFNFGQNPNDAIDLVGVAQNFDIFAHLTDAANPTLGSILTLDSGATIEILQHTVADLETNYHNDFHIMPA